MSVNKLDIKPSFPQSSERESSLLEGSGYPITDFGYDKNVEWHFNKQILFNLFVSFIFLSLIFITGCGRKGDPIPIIPPQEKTSEKNSEKSKPNDAGSVPAVNKSESDAIKGVQLAPPTGLTAVYMESSIVLVWDEVKGQGVKAYYIYRSSGGEYTLIGKTGIPAFTDKNIERDKKYSYKVSALAGAEGHLSKEIEVLTKPRE